MIDVRALDEYMEIRSLRRASDSARRVIDAINLTNRRVHAAVREGTERIKLPDGRSVPLQLDDNQIVDLRRAFGQRRKIIDERLDVLGKSHHPLVMKAFRVLNDHHVRGFVRMQTEVTEDGLKFSGFHFAFDVWRVLVQADGMLLWDLAMEQEAPIEAIHKFTRLSFLAQPPFNFLSGSEPTEDELDNLFPLQFAHGCADYFHNSNVIEVMKEEEPT